MCFGAAFVAARAPPTNEPPARTVVNPGKPASPAEVKRLAEQVRRWEEAVRWQQEYVRRLKQDPHASASLVAGEQVHLRGLQAMLDTVRQEYARKSHPA